MNQRMNLLLSTEERAAIRIRDAEARDYQRTLKMVESPQGVARNVKSIINRATTPHGFKHRHGDWIAIPARHKELVY